MIDRKLQSFAAWAEDTSSEADQPVTITVNGLVITGVVISGDEFTRCVADYIDRFSEHPDTEEMTLALREIFGALGDDEHPSRYIHLREAKILARSVGGPVRVPCWRAALEAVDGFTLGGLAI